MKKKEIYDKSKNVLFDLISDNEENNLRKAYANLAGINNPNDIDSSIENAFLEFDLIKKRKVKNEDIRFLSIIFIATMIIGLFMIKNLFIISIFILGIGISSVFLSKFQRRLSRIAIGYRAYEGVLLKLHEMKIFRALSD